MTERQLQFRVGLFVIMALFVAVILVLTFGEMKWLFQRYYTLQVHFDEAPGVQAMTPVRKNGIGIGEVREVFFNEERGGVTVVVELQERYQLRRDSRARLTQSLLGDASIEFSPGQSGEFFKEGETLKGEAPFDPMKLVKQMEGTLTRTMTSFEGTSEEWRKVGKNVNSLVDTNRGNLEVVIERAAESLHQFTLTLENANAVVGNPQNQENLERTLAALPKMVEETRQTIEAVKLAVGKADQNLENLSHVTQPLAERSRSIITKLDNSVGNLDSLLVETNQFARMLNSEEGSLKKFVADPALYRNLNQSAEQLSILLQNLKPTMADLKLFADKVARHPEILGVRGAMKPSSGIKR